MLPPLQFSMQIVDLWGIEESVLNAVHTEERVRFKEILIDDPGSIMTRMNKRVLRGFALFGDVFPISLRRAGKQGQKSRDIDCSLLGACDPTAAHFLHVRRADLTQGSS